MREESVLSPVSHSFKHLIITAVALSLAACERAETPAPATTATQPAPMVSSDTSAAARFAGVRSATIGKARVYGSYTRGCISGAEQLAGDAPHWQVLNPSRNRAWGHPVLVRFVRNLADAMAADGYRGLLVGDLAQPRGGPAPSDHNSHQVGLDADIWLTPLPSRKLSAGELESYEPPSMVNFSTLTVNQLFGPAQVVMLKRAAMAGDVERIFVSPPIKRALCQRASPGDREWLRKIRPWRGHSAHMHVRISCPIDSDDCKEQDPPPEGDGCGPELQSWFDNRGWTKEGKRRYEPEHGLRLNQLPARCRALLTERG